ncbi:hypothetical protein QBC46DRAFT_382684 [Diplogelasinospora grovesii]|uniref:Aminoglycoside phosphotransferase domain-containing protein n=1 Tax=Diplogelasinospora grovesii TaxID=303347 RepID=A0AAN6S5R0_9PEZI|nr:hypothetical protein QBC46DRAFT_382684 [Diplogelasinospora grovesii]
MPGQAHVTKEFRGLDPPPGARIPTPDELVRLCTAEHARGYNMGLAYPPESPIFWIKYGTSIVWNEVLAQTKAHRELHRAGSPVRVPGVFYACEMGALGVIYNFEVSYKSYIVMEYIPGETAAKLLENVQDSTAKQRVYRGVASALDALYRIPVPLESRPAAVDGGLIRHPLFDEQQAPRHYQSVEQLEQHLNNFLAVTKRKERVRELAREPMIFCYSDIWLENFIIGKDGRVSVVDFADVSILPASFANFALSGTSSKIRCDISTWVNVPATTGVDNTNALIAVSGPMVMGSSSFVKVGRQIPGGEEIDLSV